MAVDLWSLLGGSAALAGGAAMDKEPGEVTQARQYLRNVFTSPNALADDFTGQLGAIQNTFEPYIRQQEKYALDDIQQRAIAGQPQSFTTAMSGPELNALRTTNENVLAPRRQAFMGELGLNFLNQRANAASSILNTSKPDPLASAISQLGLLLLMNSMGGNSGGSGGINWQSILGGGQGQGQQGGGIGSILSQLGGLFGGGATGGTTAGAGGATTGGGGILSLLTNPAFALPAAAAAATVGGYKIGSNNPGLADMPGWGKALTMLGTLGLAGPAFLGANNKQKQLKEEYRQSDLSSQADQVQEIGTFFDRKMQQLGIDTGAFQARIKYLVATSESEADEQGIIAQEGGKQLLAALQAQDPSITSLNQVPGLRQEFIEYLTSSTFSSGNSSYGGGAPTGMFPGWASTAGL